MSPDERKMMRSYSVTVSLTPRQAMAAANGLYAYAVTQGSSRAFVASHRIINGLLDAGWRWDDDHKAWVYL